VDRPAFYPADPDVAGVEIDFRPTDPRQLSGTQTVMIDQQHVVTAQTKTALARGRDQLQHFSVG
jgi:hypothetical protein